MGLALTSALELLEILAQRGRVNAPRDVLQSDISYFLVQIRLVTFVKPEKSAKSLLVKTYAHNFGLINEVQSFKSILKSVQFEGAWGVFILQLCIQVFAHNVLVKF